jgi:MarR family transcriptional regulator for hemolysin
MDAVRVTEPVGPPREEPIGIVVARAGKAADRAFDDALATAGGNRPTWLVLLAVKTGAGRTQTGLADRIGISGPTLTHHLDHLEAAGLVQRSRDPANRRVQTITLTATGDALFLRLRNAAVEFDRRLRARLTDSDIAALRRTLTMLYDNVTAGPSMAGASSPTKGVHA